MSDRIVETYLNLSEAVDKTTVRELMLYITNDGQLYRQRISPIIKNLSKKVGKATYDGEKAIKGMMYAVKDGIKKYEKEHAGPGWAKSINKETKNTIASELLDYYSEEIGEETKPSKKVGVLMDKVTETYVNLDEITSKQADQYANAARGYDEAWQEASHVGQLLRELVTSVNRLAKSPHGKTAKQYAKIFQKALDDVKKFKTLAKSATKDLQRQADERWKDDDDETFHAGTKKKKGTKRRR
jgi:hypothetical protein